MYKGIAASRGIGIGSICRLIEHDLSFEAKMVSDTDAEKARFRAAIDSFVEDTNAMADEIRKNIGPKEAEILLGHAVMISDPAMSGEMYKMIEAGQCAESALTAVCDMFIGMFSQMEDEMMRQRASDISDVKVSVLKKLLGIEDIDTAVSGGKHGGKFLLPRIRVRRCRNDPDLKITGSFGSRKPLGELFCIGIDGVDHQIKFICCTCRGIKRNRKQAAKEEKKAR